MKNENNDSPLDDIRIGQVTRHWAEAQKISCFYFDVLDSTNVKAKSEAFSEKNLEEQLVIYVADRQTAGKGRGGNSWSSARPGSQLLSTWSFMIDGPAHPTVTPMMGLSLYRAASATWPFLDWNLKAPNDLYIGGKKVAGLLLETVSQGNEHRLLVGLGLNVLAAPGDVGTACSLLQKLPPEAPLLAEDWIAFLERLLFEFSFSLQLSFEPMNNTSTASLLKALNLHPLLESPYISLDGSGNLATASRKISWMEL